MKGFFFGFIALLLLFGCYVKEEKTPLARPVAFVSIPPQAGLLKHIVEGRYRIHTLVGERQSPHSYELTVRQMGALKNADVFFTIGLPFEKALLKKINKLYPELRIVRTENGIPLRSMTHVHHAIHCDHEHGEKDPHVWLNPLHALTVAENMCRALEQIDPEHIQNYQKNFDRLARTLQTLDIKIERKLAPYKNRRFYVFHPSFGYFADRYGLIQAPIELEGKSPPPRQLARLIEQARADGANIVFIQKQFPSESTQAFAEAINGSVIQLNPLAENIVEYFEEISGSVDQALKR